jgi:DNA-binding PadR family transcriptional regulator
VDDFSGLGRYSGPALLVLASLADEPRHGYGITKDVEQFSGVSIGPGTLYGVLARLEDAGLVEALPAQDRRRPYRLTPAGVSALATQLRSMQRIAATGLARLATA